MSLFSYSSFEEDAILTLRDVKDDISRMMGLEEIKAQLATILSEIEIAGKASTKIVPPKPFHMAFIGNSGTGKSMVAQVLGKLFYLAGALPHYDLTEMDGQRARIKNAKGGVLFVNVGEQLSCEVLQEIGDVMDSGETAVIFAGKRQHLNRCMQANKELYKRLSVTLHFNDLSCEELAMMLLQSLCTDQPYKLHSACSVGTVRMIIEKETIGKLRSQLNGRMIDTIIQEIKNSLALRLSFDATDHDANPASTITIADLEAGVSNMANIYTALLC